MVRLMSDRGIDLRRAGVNSYFGNCPFHDERTGSFHVSPDERLYHCFGCQASGDAFKFVMETEGVDFVGALESLASRFGVTLETRDEDPEAAARRERFARLTGLLNRAATFYARYLWESAEAEEAREYLRGRGLAGGGAAGVPRRLLAWHRLGSDHHHLPQGRLQRAGVDRRRARGSVSQVGQPGPSTTSSAGRSCSRPPTNADGSAASVPGACATTRHPTAGRGRSTSIPSDGTLYHKREVLFGVHLARGPAAKAGRMILAEGYTDVLALHQAGIRNAVGIMGTSLTNEQVETLAKIAGDRGVVPRRRQRRSSGDVEGGPGGPGSPGAPRGWASRRLRPGGSGGHRGSPRGSGRGSSAIGCVRASSRSTGSWPTVTSASAEGRDRALAELAPVLAALGPSALRDELMRRVSGALELAPARLASALEQAGAHDLSRIAPGPGRVPGARGGTHTTVWERGRGCRERGHEPGSGAVRERARSGGWSPDGRRPEGRAGLHGALPRAPGRGRAGAEHT